MLSRLLLAAGGLTFALFALPAVGRPDDPAKPTDLPVTRVVLFNAGVGYFQREGSVDGDARVELRFPEGDVNDLLKSLVLDDRDGGRVRAVTYDGKHPVEVTLKAFAVDLTENPTVGQILHQVRGEKIEITDRLGATVAGLIVGVERAAPAVVVPPANADEQPGRPVVVNPAAAGDEQVNLLTADGLQSVALRQAKRIKLMRPELDAEFRQALEVLAAARGSSKKAVSVAFTGNGRRRVKVGYVTEAPMWKPSYRLTLDGRPAEEGPAAAAGPAAGRASANAAIQGWAAVENTTEEDWKGVRVGLVAGRPMAFQMNLYDPLFVPRPVVEPELYSSLRPPVHQGAMTAAPTGIGGLGVGGIGGFGGGAASNLGFGGGVLGVGGGQQGQFGNLGMQGAAGYSTQLTRPSARELLLGNRLSYAELVKRLDGEQGEDGKKPDPASARDVTRTGVLSAAAAVSLGDVFEYRIPDPVTLPRLKSALLPIVTGTVGCRRVSVYNARVLGTHPLLGLRLANDTRLHLAAGPVTVYEADTFAGDARLPDLAPGESRLVSYAIDLDTEVVPRPREPKVAVERVRVGGGLLHVTRRLTEAVAYSVRNRGPKARALVVEHPARPDWRPAAGGPKPAETTRDLVRYELAVPAGGSATLEVAEERTDARPVPLYDLSSDDLREYEGAAGPAVRAVLAKVVELRAKAAAVRRALADEEVGLKAIADDQARLRANLAVTPKEAEAYRRYLKKFDEQETEIERRQARAKELTAQAAKAEAEHREYATKAVAE